ncbi:MAG: phosphoribosylglycinamide formyltransferase [Ginsengibacter sp.]
MINIAIFASGAGSNAEKIVAFFEHSHTVSVNLIVSNRANARVLNVAGKWKISALIIEKEQFYSRDHYLGELKKYQIDFIVLAGFLWKIPDALISSYRQKIINIHPALLPKYGGKNMYGNYVHEAVIASNDKISGITIHYVDEHYDHGDVIFQAQCDIEPGETALSLAEKIHKLEHEHFPKIVEAVIKQTFKSEKSS